MHWKIDNYVLILLQMYWRTFSNIFGNLLKIATPKSGNFYKSMIIYIVRRMVTHDNPR